jgi:hypothetical protein
MAFSLVVYSDGTRYIYEKSADETTVVREIEGTRRPGTRVTAYIDIGYSAISPSALQEIKKGLIDLLDLIP